MQPHLVTPPLCDHIWNLCDLIYFWTQRSSLVQWRCGPGLCPDRCDGLTGGSFLRVVCSWFCCLALLVWWWQFDVVFALSDEFVVSSFNDNFSWSHSIAMTFLGLAPLRWLYVASQLFDDLCGRCCRSVASIMFLWHICTCDICRVGSACGSHIEVYYNAFHCQN